jgi:hypothetical protein
MALQYKKYEGELINLGTITELSATFGFSSDRNLESTKRVTLILEDGDGGTVAVPCSSEVSDHIRRALKAGKPENWVLSSLRNLSLLEVKSGEKAGRIYISPVGQPGSRKKTMYSVAELQALNANFEDLMKAYEGLAV